ncbi:fumarylacetoacetate hydrolase family protein [Halopiger aswanensis]|uniref:2-keto-4-pentenoate hydratase/2-oxohepta-3-ene-1,7-dioic acid hydratase in catechol pathway n=1 Tax=Halopiger aswanensis TaxID=148449 RepID=A0A419W199_9EURY|nr:fumarylacetoacetate hydrolase family protein [Halopiger aswanensis]RKD89251.1 2-keto-4-pentenoate hydratase/2-oxohepta-3-ene-1,7-dioic acid hydratase in catechol pathway [Halopiger aswanensis]
MQFVRFATDGSVRWGVTVDDQTYDLTRFGEPTLEELASPGYRRRVRRAVETGELPEIDDPEDRLAPVPSSAVDQIICVGLNYHDHAEEQDEEIPEKPMLFAKSPSTVTDPEAPIVHPDDVEQVDYEVELGIVIGRTACEVSAEEAEEYVAGYTVIDDVSARDAQFEDGQFFRGKSYDTFAPMGPALTSPDAVDPNDLEVELRLNGEVKQESTTAEFIFDVGEVIEYISNFTTLRPGTVISTGTPGGVGIFRDPPELLSPGDTVEAEIEGIGTLENPVVGTEE